VARDPATPEGGHQQGQLGAGQGHQEERIVDIRNATQRRVLLGATISLLALAAVAAPGATLAKHGGSSAIIRTGSCTGSSDWKLKLKKDDGRIEVEFEVDQDRNGKTWNVALKQDGTSFWTGQRTTHAPSGSFSVERRATDRPGTHQFVGRAVNPRTGEVCRGSATI
jgi:hypothetical protein